MKNPKTEKQNHEKGWSKPGNEEAIKRVADFMKEDDESFFRRIIQELTVPEIEAFLDQCPEFRKFWDHEDIEKERRKTQMQGYENYGN